MSSPDGSTVVFRRPHADVRPRALTLFARKLQREVAKGRPFDCLITGDAELARLNSEYRGKDYATDVLSFPSLSRAEARRRLKPAPRNPSPRNPASSGAGFSQQGTSVPLGDLAISVGRARVQAREFGHSTEDEIRILMLHGVLHLLGLDHESDKGQMARAERRWRSRLNLPNGLIERVQS